MSKPWLDVPSYPLHFDGGCSLVRRVTQLGPAQYLLLGVALNCSANEEARKADQQENGTDQVYGLRPECCCALFGHAR